MDASTSHPEQPRLGDRSLFPDLQARAYLAHAAISPLAAPVRAAVERLLADYARDGVGAFGHWQSDREALRILLAQLIGATEEDIALLPNTTSGIIAIAQSFPWQRGDRVVAFAGDFPANVTPWQRAAARYDLDLVLLPMADFGRSGGTDWAHIDSALARGVRLVAISAVQFQTGLRVPLAELAARCRASGAQLLVDGVQACGALPLNVRQLGIDYLACGGHKWLMGMEGGGFLYVAPTRIAGLRPHLAGWLSHLGALDFLLEGPGHLRYDRPIRQRADFLEVGMSAAASLAALHAAVKLLTALGTHAIFDHVSAYLDCLEPQLLTRGFRSLRPPDDARRSCILSVVPPPTLDAVALVAALAEGGILCSAPDGLLRIAPHWPNDVDEIPHVIATIDEACVKLRS